MENFKQETLESLTENGKTIADVLWVGTKDGFIPKDKFFNSIDFNYDSGFGGAKIAEIMIVGELFYMYRGEYDGSEWWEFVDLNMLNKPKAEHKDFVIRDCSWDDPNNTIII